MLQKTYFIEIIKQENTDGLGQTRKRRPGFRLVQETRLAKGRLHLQ